MTAPDLCAFAHSAANSQAIRCFFRVEILGAVTAVRARFPSGVQSIGSTPVERWRKILRRAQEEGALCRRRRAITVFVRHHFDLKRKIHSRYPMPTWLTMDQLNDLLGQMHGGYAVQWL